MHPTARPVASTLPGPRRGSRLLLTNEIPALESLPYPRREDSTLNADGVVSRKMQLLPAILGALEG